MEHPRIHRLQSYAEAVIGFHGRGAEQTEELAVGATFVEVHRAGDSGQIAHRSLWMTTQIHQTEQPAHAISDQTDVCTIGVLLNAADSFRQPVVDVSVQR